LYNRSHHRSAKPVCRFDNIQEKIRILKDMKNVKNMKDKKNVKNMQNMQK